MNTNDQIVLDAILHQKKTEIASDLSDHDYFEIFTAEQILKDYDLSWEEIQIGLVGNGGDGGIDSIYLFINDDLIKDDVDFNEYQKRDVPIDLFIIQSKTESSFKEEPINKFIAVTNDILDLSKDIDDLKYVYNEALLSIVNRFRKAYIAIVRHVPKLTFHFYYITKGTIVDPKVERKTEQLTTCLKDKYSSAILDFKFIKARDLTHLTQRAPYSTFNLVLSCQPMSIGNAGSVICIVKLKDYFNFITDSNSKLIMRIFESNVRDYLGDIEVNQAIFETLQSRIENEDFWWLNNGITVIANKAFLSGNILTIENPQIVNGLQTSRVVHKYFTEHRSNEDPRNILVRVIIPADDTESRDKIIKATNFQTTIPAASLRASEKIHRDIEEYFKPYGLYYDRRKNFYKNQGKPINKIVSISYLAQAVMAVYCQRPDDARARPSSLLKNAEDYLKVFSEEYDIKLYLSSVLILRKIDKFLKDIGNEHNQREKGNIKYYIAMFLVMKLTKKSSPAISDIIGIKVEEITTDLIHESYSIVYDIYENLGGSDQVAKGSDFKEKLRDNFKILLH